MEIPIEKLELIFGEIGEKFMPLIFKLSDEFPEVQYEFISTEEHYKIYADNYHKGQEIYWREILYRLHLASTITIVRIGKWIEGIVLGVESNNFLLFATSFRALIEACADSDETLRHIPLSISEIFSDIQKTIQGKAEKPLTFKELEDKLIHFSHAAIFPKTDVVPSNWKALTTKKYIEHLDGMEDGDIYKSYKELCNLAHPAGFSVRYNFSITVDNNKTAIYKKKKEMDIINIIHFAKKYRPILNKLITVPTNLALMNLKILNKLPIEELHTPLLEEINLNYIPLFNEIKKNIKNCA